MTQRWRWWQWLPCPTAGCPIIISTPSPPGSELYCHSCKTTVITPAVTSYTQLIDIDDWEEVKEWNSQHSSCSSSPLDSPVSR